MRGKHSFLLFTLNSGNEQFQEAVGIDVDADFGVRLDFIHAFNLVVVAVEDIALHIAFAVSDSGIGLTLAEIKRLFRPFSQANVRVASRYGGAGLGLSSVKQLARLMGGDI